MYPKVAFTPKQHTHSNPLIETPTRDAPNSWVVPGLASVEVSQPSLGSLTLLTPLGQGSHLQACKGKGIILWEVWNVYELPGSHVSALRTAQLRCDKPTVMAPEKAIRRSWTFQCEGR